MLTRALIVLAYYVFATAAVSLWTFRDFTATRRRVPGGMRGPQDRAARFLMRTAIAFGIVAGGGAGLVLGLLMSPAPDAWITVAAALAAAALTSVGIVAIIRVWPDITHTDPLAELRPTDPAPSEMRVTQTDMDTVRLS